MQTEKRQFPRASCEIESSFTSLSEDIPQYKRDTLVRDISEGGLRFRTNHFIPVHEKLLFRISLPKTMAIEAVAQPAWIREMPVLSQYDVGAKFISLSDTDRDIIRRWVQNDQFRT